MQNLSKYTDPEVEALQNQIKRLKNEITLASDEIADIEKLIHDFSIRHAIELGVIIRKLLNLRMQKLEQEQNGSETKQREYEDAKSEYESYNHQYERNVAEKRFNLTDEQQKELKAKYRKATKLCHPDLVDEKLNKLAEEVFKELQKAYEENDLDRVSEIYEMLDKGDMFMQKLDEIDEAEKLKADIRYLEDSLSILKMKLNELKISEPYILIASISDWDEYFTSTRDKLQYELESIQKELNKN